MCLLSRVFALFVDATFLKIKVPKEGSSATKEPFWEPFSIQFLKKKKKS